MAGSIFSRTLAGGRAVRALPLARLLVLAELALLVREHAIKLEPYERRRLAELLIRGRGRTRNLSAWERLELARLVAKAEPKLFARAALRKFSPIGL